MPESFDVFLSYNWQDQAEVQQIYLRLREQGLKPWIDGAELGPGPWRENLQMWMAQIPRCLVFLGRRGFGKNQKDEIAAALHLEKSSTSYVAIVVLLPGVTELPPENVFLNKFNQVRFRASLDEAEPAQKLVAWLKGRSTPLPTSAQDCPYRGLEKFNVEHAGLFFGREDLTETLLKKVTTAISTRPARRFLAIEGASGSGKSSLARAGLLARLKSGALEKSEQWRCGIVQPGGDPLYSLALEVGRSLGQDTTAILNLKKELRGSVEALKTFLDLHLGGEPEHVRFVLLVDQFEELYTTCQDEQARQAFIDNLLEAARNGKRGVVIVAVRADFLGKCAGHAELAGAMSDSCVLVGPMNDEELRRAIERPAVMRHCLFEPGLVEQLLSDVKRQPGNLPLLQFALKELWQKKQGNQLTLEAYRDVGGVQGALEQHAERIYAAVPDSQKETWRRLFLRLTNPGEGTEDTRRRVSMSEVLPVEGFQEVIFQLSEWETRLLTVGKPEDWEGEFVEVAHEALIRGWARLRQWIDSDRAGLQTQRRLTEAAKQWQEKNKDADFLLAGSRLTVMEEFARRHDQDLNPLENEFLKKSRGLVIRRRRLRVVLGVTLGLVLIALGFVFWLERARAHAAGLVDQLLKADTPRVPDIVAGMTGYRYWTDERLRDEFRQADSRQQLHISLALLPVDAGQVDYLFGRLLDAEPAQFPVIRDALAKHWWGKQAELAARLWTVVENDKPEKGNAHQRLRAAAALATYEPNSQRWDKCSMQVVADLVAENPVYLGLWSEAFRPAREKLLAPLSAVFRAHQAERTAERNLATSLLADYAADQPQVLADLLMDADERQFLAIYPKFKEQGRQGLSVLTGEIEKKPVIVGDKIVFAKEGTIAEGDAKVKTKNGTLPAKKFEVGLQGGKTYRMTMDSTDLDSFLILQDKSGMELGSDDDSGGGLNSLLVYTPPSEGTFVVFAAALQNQKGAKDTGSFVLKIMEKASVDDNAKEKLAKRQANAAVALLRMNQPEKVWPLLKHSPDPRLRSYLLHRFQPLGADPTTLFARYQQEKDVSIQRALLLALGDFGEPGGVSPRSPTPSVRETWTAELLETYRNHPDPGLHGAAEWLLRQWQQDDRLKKIDEELANQAASAPGEKRQWYVNKQGQTLAVIHPKEFWMGSPPEEAGRIGGPTGRDEMKHFCKIGRAFAVATKEVTVRQFRSCPAFKEFDYNKVYAPTLDHPINRVSWYEAAEYCNWLSKEEGLQECYEPNAQGQYAEGMKMKAAHLKLNGYRLPTETEWEYACRADAVTSRYYGETDELMGKYAWYTKNSQDRWMLPMEKLKADEPNLKPNDFGLFHMLGNAYEWCQDDAVFYPVGTQENPSIDREDKNDIAKGIMDKRRRVLRGGSFNDLASLVRSADRTNYVPTNRFNSNGFRVARTLPLSSLTPLPLNSPKGSHQK